MRNTAVATITKQNDTIASGADQRMGPRDQYDGRKDDHDYTQGSAFAAVTTASAAAPNMIHYDSEHQA